MSPETIVYLLPALVILLIASVIGVAIGYALLRKRRRELVTSQNSERELENRIATLETENRRIEELNAEQRRLNDKVNVLQGDRDRFSGLAEERANTIQKLEEETIKKLEGKIERREEIISGAQETNKKLSAEIAQLREAREADSRRIDELKEVRKNFEDTFNTISKNALKENRESFARESLEPVKTKLDEFAKMVDTAYKSEAVERSSLRGEIKTLVDLNHQISKEASNLASALKRDTKKQGNWGELILEKVLEFSGLRKGMEYKLQESVKNDAGQSRFPDAIVYLPENKHIIIDSKVSLIAFERYCSSESDEQRSEALLQHITSVKKHIMDLSETDYPSLPTMDAPDFTLLFMPIESSFGLAVQADNELFEYAWNRKIVIVSPSTLLATLRTISSIWKQERQTKNALEIADSAGKMYDKFVGFVEDLIIVGKKMDEAKGAYGGAMNKLSSGKGNLVGRAEDLKDKGAKATKQLPQILLDRAIENGPMESVAAGPGLPFE